VLTLISLKFKILGCQDSHNQKNPLDLDHSEAPRGYVPEFKEEDTSKLMKWQNSLQHCNMLLASTLCILISGMLCWIVCYKF